MAYTFRNEPGPSRCQCQGMSLLTHPEAELSGFVFSLVTLSTIVVRIPHSHHAETEYWVTGVFLFPLLLHEKL